MSTKIHIQSARTGNTAKVTEFGQLVVAPLAYSTPVAITLDAPGQVFNFIEPSAGQSIVITDIIVFADKNVNNTNPAEVEIFESNGISSLDVIESIVSPQVPRSQGFPMIGLNLLVPEGRFVNATTTDANIKLTIMFYRVPQDSV